MNLKSLNDRQARWLGGGPHDDVVVSSRVRLARNLEGYPFPSHCSKRQRARVEQLVGNTLRDLEHALNYVRLDELTPLMRELLLERHLISRRAAEAEGIRAVGFDDAERMAVIVNEEDHLRIQCTLGGLSLSDAYGCVDELDDRLAEKIPFAFSDRYGFLTASPMNVGTGMRASVMLHLPATAMAHEMESMAQIVQEARLAVQGAFGEGVHGSADIYSMYNLVTLGLPEEEILNGAEETVKKVADLERSCRSNLSRHHPGEFEQRIQGALELLCSATAVSSQEALKLLSLVRLGVEMDLLEGVGMDTVNELFLLTLPAHLQTMEGRELDTTVRNRLRADYLKVRLENT